CRDLLGGIAFRVSSLWCCRWPGGDRPRIAGVVSVLGFSLSGLCLCD
ncbi:Os01g0136600, partial [Oryza sativa Japonica Group]